MSKTLIENKEEVIERGMKYILAQAIEHLKRDDHDGVLCVVLYDTRENTAVAIDTAYDNDEGDKKLDMYERLLEDSRFELRLLQVSADDLDTEEDD